MIDWLQYYSTTQHINEIFGYSTTKALENNFYDQYSRNTTF